MSCAVCGDYSSGNHYGVLVCDGCALFFKRSVQSNRQYTCIADIPGECLVDRVHRKHCRACRFKKCHQSGMNKYAVQVKSGFRDSTIRRQMAGLTHVSPPRPDVGGPVPPPLNLMPKHSLVPPPIQIYNPYSYPVPPQPLPPPVLSPVSISPGPICEAAARLLFMNVRWTPNIPLITNLPMEHRLAIIEETWKNLFILGAAQYLFPIDSNVNTNIAI